MEQSKGSLTNQIHIQQQQQQNHAKKKSKNKKKNSKTESNIATKSYEGQQIEQLGEEFVTENGLADELKQQLHISNNSKTNLNDSKSSSCSSSSNHKVNGLITENLKKSNACPSISTNACSNKVITDDHKTPAPVLNGHNLSIESTCSVNGHGSPISQSVAKKSKRKPNNKKNSCSLDNDKTNVGTPNRVETEAKDYIHDKTQILASETTLNTAMTVASTAASSPNINNDAKHNLDSPQQQQHQPKEDKAQEQPEFGNLSKIPPAAPTELDLSSVHIEYKEYESELQMHVSEVVYQYFYKIITMSMKFLLQDIMRLIQAELSEPYSIYTYRYFIYNWPKLCFLAAHGNEYVGAIVCKLDMHMNVRRGYIAMLAVRKEYRKLKIGTTLVQKAIEVIFS